MSQVILIRPGATLYDEQNRVQGVLDIPLSERGVAKWSGWRRRSRRAWATRRWPPCTAAPARTPIRTAEIVGKVIGVRPKRINEFRNLDQGLWQGLQIDEIKRRNTQLFRQWIEDPATICPPQGETVERAMERIKAAFRPLLRRHQDEAIGLVVGEPLARLVACYLRCEPRVQLDERWSCCEFEWIEIAPILLKNGLPEDDRHRRRSASLPRTADRCRAPRRRPRRADDARGLDGRGSRHEGSAMDSRKDARAKTWHGHFEPKKVPDGVWIRCDGCQATLFRKQVEQNLLGLPGVQPPLRVSAVERINQLLDTDTFEEWFADLQPVDPLGFNDRRPYPERVKAEQALTGLKEAAVVGQGFIRGIRIVFGVTDSNFIMGSMGSVVGREADPGHRGGHPAALPLVIVSGSGGGARMHEGIFSLMQMAKVSTALGRYHAAGGLYLSVLTHPTMGGVAASFASLGDFILAEPKALIGFAGPRVIEQTVRVQLPAGFQTSEFLLEHGFIDRIVHRRDLQSTIAQLIDYAMP